uniref:Uncharacterized protein n=1 Tax=Peronospora matthiolae TaxID=2874970 RepID=A0AAV1VCG0_9STRA
MVIIQEGQQELKIIALGDVFEKPKNIRAPGSAFQLTPHEIDKGQSWRESGM